MGRTVILEEEETSQDKKIMQYDSPTCFASTTEFNAPVTFNEKVTFNDEVHFSKISKERKLIYKGHVIKSRWELLYHFFVFWR